MGWMTGLEPATSRITIWRSNQLSYTHHEKLLWFLVLSVQGIKSFSSINKKGLLRFLIQKFLGEAKGENGLALGSAFNPNFSAVGFYEPFSDIESQANS